MAQTDVTLTLSPYERRDTLTRRLPHLIVSLEGGLPLAGATRIRLESVNTVLLGRGVPAANGVGGAGGCIQLKLQDPFLSKQHAVLSCNRGEWYIHDEQSRNGTFIHRDGFAPVQVRSGQPEHVPSGSWIRLGRTFLRFREALPCAQEAEWSVRRQPYFLSPGLVSALPALEQQFYDAVVLAARPFRHALISGETGTGKELLARALHDLSPRSSRPFVSVNCGRLSDHAHAELFGVEGRTFANADAKQGFIRNARGGTLFLDEIGKLSIEVQDSLLRVLDSGEVQPVGADRTETIPMRELNVVFAANEDLAQLVREGRFLPDLRARIGSTVFELPPLRERMDDVGLILAQLLQQLEAEGVVLRIEEIPFSNEAISAIIMGAWPWNIRGLREGLRAQLVAGHEGALGPESFEAALRRQGNAAGGPADGAAGPQREARRRLLSDEQARRRAEILNIYAAYVQAKGERGAKSHVAESLGYKGVNYLAKDELRLGITRGDYERAVGQK